jgi:hypothetical protein
MSIAFNLPADLEKLLRRQFDNLDEAAKEAALLELYRQNKLTHHHLSKALNLSRFEIDALLKAHNVTEDLPSEEELAGDLQRLRKLAAC